MSNIFETPMLVTGARRVARGLLGASFACLASASPAQAWIYPEHRQIGVDAWQRLDPHAQDFYRALWQRARGAHGVRWCEAAVAGTPFAPQTSDTGRCIDFADWPALAADHSCSPDELLANALQSDWAARVASVSDQLREDLAHGDTPAKKENVWFTSNLLLQDVDDAYVTRAGANNAHFMLPLSGDTLAEFLEASTRRGAPLNALGLYVQYHGAALRLAAALGSDGANADLVSRVLALEAYALHFLQDMFSSGHVVGTWGDAATRKGTHDYYCAHGYSTTTWSGQHWILYGDAHITPVDLSRAARAMARSMTQVVAAADAAREAGGAVADARALAFASLDSCQSVAHPAGLPMDAAVAPAIEAVLVDTPLPGRGPDSASWPRHRADFGPFIGLESSLSLGGSFGGYGSNSRAFSELGMGVRIGYGLEDVVAIVNSGTMYLHLGLVRQSEQRDICSDGCGTELGSATLPRVPSRAGVALGLRMPFYVVPGDLLLLAPVLALVSPTELTRVAIRAASGGLIPWQRTFATPVGYVEMVAGRIVDATFHGASARVRTFAYVDDDLGEPALASVGFRSVTLTFPLVEYTPLRMFAQTLTAALQIQLAYAIDLPFDMTNYGGGAAPEWGPAHMFLMRLSLTGRGYL